MIVLFTDFGMGGPYVGQMHAVLAQQAPAVPVIDLFHEAPRYDIQAAAYLLPAYTQYFPPGTVFICVVDPGVGGARRALILKVDHRWYVGPDNGLFHILARRAQDLECHEICWRPTPLSASFHARDLFAPVAAQLAHGMLPECVPAAPAPPASDWPEDLAQVLYLDSFGNAITGIRAIRLGCDVRLKVGGTEVAYARTYSEVPTGQGFWYENSNGLVEIAANRARASDLFGIAVGDNVGV